MGEIIHEVRMTSAFWAVSFGLMVIGFIGMAVFIMDQPMVVRIVLFASALTVLLVIPDMRAYYGTEGIKLTFGPGGIWKKRIPRDEVTYISIIEFNPMRDFGGWGIKGGRGQYRGILMWATPSTGNRGLLIETVSGRKYLVGHKDLEETLGILKGLYPTEARPFATGID